MWVSKQPENYLSVHVDKLTVTFLCRQCFLPLWATRGQGSRDSSYKHYENESRSKSMFHSAAYGKEDSEMIYK